MIKKLNQKGFGALELVIVILVVAILGGGGLYVWHRTKTKSSPSSTVATSQTKTNQTPTSGTKVINTTLSNVPSGLKTAVMNNLSSHGCLDSNGQIGAVGGGSSTDPNSLAVYYTANGGAMLNACDVMSLYSYSGGQWQYDISGQDDFSCSQLSKYNFPAVVLSAYGNSAAQCVNASGTLQAYSN